MVLAKKQSRMPSDEALSGVWQCDVGARILTLVKNAHDLDRPKLDKMVVDTMLLHPKLTASGKKIVPRLPDVGMLGNHLQSAYHRGSIRTSSCVTPRLERVQEDATEIPTGIGC
jgi:hypothetical protein